MKYKHSMFHSYSIAIILGAYQSYTIFRRTQFISLYCEKISSVTQLQCLKIVVFQYTRTIKSSFERHIIYMYMYIVGFAI